MATYRLMDGQSGRPGVGSSGTQPPASPTGYSGNYEAGLVFQVTEGGKYFQGYWWYVPTGGDTNGNVGFALWQTYGSNQATVIPASEMLWTGSFTAGAWNFVPCNPIPLTPGVPYVAQIGYQTTIGFPMVQNQFGAGQPYASGITNGPLTAYGGTAGSSDYTWPQEPFSTGGADASVTLSFSNDLNDLLWLDIQITDQVPPGTPERAWPTLPSPSLTSSNNGAYTLGMQFSLSRSGQLTSIWHYSPPTSTVLPTRCAIWDVTSQAVVTGTDNSSPTWTTVDGKTAAAGAGWVKCDYRNSNVTLVTNKQYKVSTFSSGSGIWWAGEDNVFGSSQLYANGFTHDILTIPGSGSASSGQSSYNASAWGYPNTASGTNTATWIDVEIVPVQVSTNRIWPTGGGAAVAADTNGGTLTTQFSLTEDSALSAIWWYSPSGATALPSQCGIFRDSDQTLVASNTSATWSGAVGSGWVKCTFDSTVTLSANTKYKVAAYYVGGADWYSAGNGYWSGAGAGTNGIQSGVIKAPPDLFAAGVDVGQGAYITGGAGLQYPTQTYQSSSYFVDVEVQTPHFRLLDGMNGRPGNGPTTAVSYSGNFLAGVAFEALQGGTWFEGFWWWVCPSGGQSTAAQKFALWQVVDGSHQTVVPGSVVTSGTLSTGWNWVPLSTPVQLDVSLLYCAATGFTGPFPDSDTTGTGTGAVDSYGAGGHTTGIQNGPLRAPADNNALYGAVNDTGVNVPNGVFATAGTDPTVNCPQVGSNSANFWIDVQLTTKAPSGYSGTYRAWPNNYGVNSFTKGDSTANYVVGTEMRLNTSCTLNKIWYYSPAGTAQLATRCDIWDENTQANVASNTSPAWSGAAGSGWVSCSFSGITLPAGRYRVSVYNGAATPDSWSSKQLYYWNIGRGGQYGISGLECAGPTYDGIRNSVMHVPGLYGASSTSQYTGSGANANFDQGGTTQGQSVFAVGPPNAYPNTYVKGLGQTYWVDMEVTPSGGSFVTSSTSGVLIALFP